MQVRLHHRFFITAPDGGIINDPILLRLDENHFGYAMVPVEYTELGTELEVETPRERTSAVVVRRPFIDPEKEIPKQDLATTGVADESSS